MKRKLKRLFFKDSGSVSIYAIIIILPIFVLNSLLIDTIRILSAERQVENAMETALRSTMAQYSEELASIGLFAYAGNASDANEDFENYMKKQFYDEGEKIGRAHV